MDFQLKRVTCAFCKCVMPYRQGHMKRFIRHVKFEHGIVFNVKYIMAACLMESDEMESVTDIVFKNHDVDLDDKTIDEVALRNSIVKEAAIEINFNTGDTKRKIVNEKTLDNINNKKVKIDNNSKNYALEEIYKVLDDKNEPSHYREETTANDTNVGISNQSKNEQIHLQSKPSSNKFKCDQCDAKYSRSFTLKQHKKTRHGSPEETAVSQIESILFNEDSGDENEAQKSTKLISKFEFTFPFICGFCEKSFKKESHLKQHLNKLHLNSENEQSNTNLSEVESSLIMPDAEEGGVFVGIEEDSSTAKLESLQNEADPFLSAIRDKLLEDEEDQIGAITLDGNSFSEENDQNNTPAANDDHGAMDVHTDVDIALQNDFLIL